MSSKTIKEKRTLNIHSTHPNRMSDSISEPTNRLSITRNSDTKSLSSNTTQEQIANEQKNLMAQMLEIMNRKINAEGCIAQILSAIKKIPSPP